MSESEYGRLSPDITHAEALTILSESLAKVNLDYQAVLNGIVQHVSEFLGDLCSLYLLSEDNQHFVSATFYHKDPEKRAYLQQLHTSAAIEATEGLLGTVIKSGVPLLIPVVSEKDIASTIKSAYQPYHEHIGLHSLLIVPLRMQGYTIGTLSITRDTVGNPYLKTEQLYLQKVADYAAIAITNARLYDAMQQQLAEHKRDKGALKESEKLYRTLIEQSNDAIYVALLRERRLVLVNRRFIEMFDIPLAELNASNFDMINLVAPESLPLVEARRRLRMEGKPVSPYYEFRGLARDGRLLYIEASVSYVDYRGQTAVQGILRDVTRRKQAEETLRRQAIELKALIDISSALRTASATNEILTTVLRKALHVLDAAAGSIYLFDFATEKLVLRAWEPGTIYMQEVSHQLDEGITGHVFTTGEVYMSNNINHDPKALLSTSSDQLLKTLRSTISLPLHASERIIGVLHIGLQQSHTFSDEQIRLLTAISEIAGSALDRAMIMETLEQRVGERTAQLAEVNERLTELDRLKSQFISDVSHELRTPVTNIGLYLELLEQGRPENYERYVYVLKTQKERLEELIKSILAFKNLGLGKDKHTFFSIDFNEIVSQVTNIYRPQAEAVNLTLKFEPTMSLPQIPGVPHLLYEMVSCLIANAINYTPNGQILVKTFHSDDEKWLCLEVQDTGMGIPEEDIPHLFDRFYRGQRVSQLNIPGGGLGLSIAKEIIDIHKGNIQVESQALEGSTFRVQLPIAFFQTT